MIQYRTYLTHSGIHPSTLYPYLFVMVSTLERHTRIVKIRWNRPQHDQHGGRSQININI